MAAYAIGSVKSIVKVPYSGSTTIALSIMKTQKYAKMLSPTNVANYHVY